MGWSCFDKSRASDEFLSKHGFKDLAQGQAFEKSTFDLKVNQFTIKFTPVP